MAGKKAKGKKKARVAGRKAKKSKPKKAAPKPAKYLTLSLGKKVTMKTVLIRAGKFLMGSPKSEKDRTDCEGPQHEVTIGKPFHIAFYTDKVYVR